jgi:hypothetical protein
LPPFSSAFFGGFHEVSDFMKTNEIRPRRRKRKCKSCGALYMPDARHMRDQHYCSEPACQAASKKASHQRWLHSEKGAEYREPEENKRRVRGWRESTPGYWRRTVRKRPVALQDATESEAVDRETVADRLAVGALQDALLSQHAMVVGLIAHLSGSALQDTIAETTRRYVLLGQDILGNGPGSHLKGDYCHDN